jgi:[ribosomal protein S5]-alanine N-acetyltransferase
MKTYIYQDNLETARLLTRKLTNGDIATWADFFNDKEAIEFAPDYGLQTNEEKAKFWIGKQLNRYAENRFGLQVLIDKRTNNFIGQCGLLKQEVDGKTEIEVGYHIFKKYWGQGYAPEAAKLFIDYAFENDLTDSVISIINKRNIKSQRVAEKNGLVWEKETRWSNMDVYVYRIDKKN